jgi:quercetin dioxygenase-like cupin family protein
VSYLPLAGARVVETPAATMRTYASPSTAIPAPFAVWRTEMAAGAVGPLHVVDVDQVVVVIAGQLRAEVAGREFVVPAGDSALLPAGVDRRLAAGTGDLVTVTASQPGAMARVGAGGAVAVPWAR